ncbi:hypothetical protein BH10CHL1_BH10CHL1_33460 [soil metagenome]
MEVLDRSNYYRPYDQIAIYVLYEIPGQQCFYVGKTRGPRNRLTAHLSAIEIHHNLGKTQMIHSIAKAGGKVGLCVIEWVHHSQEHEAEFYWIGELNRRGAPLTNKRRDLEAARVIVMRGQYQPSTTFESISNHECLVSRDNFRLGQDDVPRMIAKMRNESQKTLIQQVTQRMERLDADGLEKMIVLAAGLLKTRISSHETMRETGNPPVVDSVGR